MTPPKNPVNTAGFRPRCMVDILRKNLRARGMLGDGFVPESHLPKIDKPHRCCKVDAQQKVMPAHPKAHDEIADDGVDAVVDYLRRSASNDGSHADLETLANAARAKMIRRAQADMEANGVFADEEIVKLHDPQSSKRIENPGRGAGCKHVGCFDIATFIRMALQKTRQTQNTQCANPDKRRERKCHPLHKDKAPRGMCDYCKAWKCPDCAQPLELHELEFEPFTKSILENTSSATRMVKVTLSKGEWEALDEIKTEEGTGTDDDDDDGVVLIGGGGAPGMETLETNGAGDAQNPITLDSDSDPEEPEDPSRLDPAWMGIAAPAPEEEAPAPQQPIQPIQQQQPEPTPPPEEPTPPPEEPTAPPEEPTAPAHVNGPESTDITKPELMLMVEILGNLPGKQQTAAFEIVKAGYKTEEDVPGDLWELNPRQEKLFLLDCFVRKSAKLPSRDDKRDLSELVDATIARLHKEQAEEAKKKTPAQEAAAKKKKEQDLAAEKKKQEEVAARKKKEAKAKADADQAARKKKEAAAKADADQAAAKATAQRINDQREQREKVIPCRKHAPTPPSPTPDSVAPTQQAAYSSQETTEEAVATPAPTRPRAAYEEGLIETTVNNLGSVMDSLRDADRQSAFCFDAKTPGKPEHAKLKELAGNFRDLYRMTVSLVRKHDRSFSQAYNAVAVTALHQKMRESIDAADLEKLKSQVSSLQAGTKIRDFCKIVSGKDDKVPANFMNGNIIEPELRGLAEFAQECRSWWLVMIKDDRLFPKLVDQWCVGMVLGEATPANPTDPQRKRRQLALEKKAAEAEPETPEDEAAKEMTKKMKKLQAVAAAEWEAEKEARRKKKEQAEAGKNPEQKEQEEAVLGPAPESEFVESAADRLKKRKATETPEEIAAAKRKREDEAKAKAERAAKRERDKVDEWKQIWPEDDYRQCYACVGDGVCEWVKSKHTKLPDCVHPILRVPVCRGCYKHYHHEDFLVLPDEESGKMEHFKCRCCAEGGSLIFCDNAEYKCPQTICEDCILRLVGQDDLEDILEPGPWTCFCCDPTPIEPIQVRWE